MAAVAAETPAIATPSSPVQTNPIVANSTPSSAGNVAVNVNASIKPQYTEQPSTGDKTNGAIYDTKSYHKAMNGSGKIKANLMLAFWAFLLVLVSVGAGIAVFTFVLPNL